MQLLSLSFEWQATVGLPEIHGFALPPLSFRFSFCSF